MVDFSSCFSNLELIINGEKADKSFIREVVRSLNKKAVLIEKGGYLFKASADRENLYLGIIPCLNQGERNYHYNILLPNHLKCVLTGSITPEGGFSILFIPEQRPLTEEMKNGYCRNYYELARGLIIHGYSGTGELDFVTKKIMVDSGLYDKAPVSLADIVMNYAPD